MIVTELTELIGVLLIRVYQFNHKSISRLWFLRDGRPIFNQIISCTRFQEIVRVTRFNEARRARAPDKLQPIQKVFMMWNDTLLDTFVPGLYLTMDEQLLAFCGRCPFRQYILFTLGKHGIKIWTVCDSATKYVRKIDIYKGKEPQKLQNSNLGCKVVMHLPEPFKKSRRKITYDNFFTGLELGRKSLKDRLIILVGIIRKNRKEPPPGFVTAKKREAKTTLYGFQSEGTAVSCCPPKKESCHAHEYDAHQ